jgi:hypothetical protein
VWRYDRPSANLQLVGGGADGFPVRFGLLVSAGVMNNGATVEYDKNPEETAGQDLADDPTTAPDPTSFVDVDLTPAYIPLNFELRGHYNRLMVAIGSEFGFNTGGKDGDSQWIERYHIRGHDDASVAKLKNLEDGTFLATQKLFNELSINRDLYFGVSAVLGRDAGIGFGPRIGARVGWTNVPYALQTTAHIGWTLAPPGIKPLGDRVRPFVDVDARAGLSWPFKTSLAHVDPITVAPVFGLTGGVGITF